jgi:hypothetical protein
MEALKTKVAIGLTAAGIGGAAVEAAPTFGHEPGLQANAAADVFNWSVVGGNPFKEGGVHSKAEVRDVLESQDGHRALRQMGFENNDIKALEKGKIKRCHIPPNVVLDGMVSGGGDYERKVKLDGKKYPDGIPAFCVTAVHTYKKNGKLIKEKDTVKIAETCTNITDHKEKVTTQKITKKKTAPVSVTKVAENNEGKVIPTPTSTFEFDIECVRPNGKKVERKVLYMHARQVLSRICRVGGIVKVEELPVHANEEWELISPKKPAQFARLTRKGLNFVFKNREKAPKQPQSQPCVPKENEMVNEQGQCVVKPKDGSVGPGAGTDGNTNTGSTVGGSGAGGEAGGDKYPVPCVDTDNTTSGDLLASTEGETMWVASEADRDQFDICQVKAYKTQNG